MTSMVDGVLKKKKKSIFAAAKTGGSFGTAKSCSQRQNCLAFLQLKNVQKQCSCKSNMWRHSLLLCGFTLFVAARTAGSFDAVKCFFVGANLPPVFAKSAEVKFLLQCACLQLHIRVPYLQPRKCISICYIIQMHKSSDL